MKRIVILCLAAITSFSVHATAISMGVTTSMQLPGSSSDEVVLQDELFDLPFTVEGSVRLAAPEPGTLVVLGFGFVLVPAIRRSILAKRTV